MKFLEEFIASYIHCYNNSLNCIICNKNITIEKHGTLYCRYDDNIHFDIYDRKVVLIINEHNNPSITLYSDRFCFTLKGEFISINYDKEFDNIFELKDYCLNTYNRYKKNLIFL